MKNPFSSLIALFSKKLDLPAPEFSDAAKGLIKSLREETASWTYENINYDDSDCKIDNYIMRYREAGRRFSIGIYRDGIVSFNEFDLTAAEKSAVFNAIYDTYVKPAKDDVLNRIRKERENKAQYFANKLKA